MYIQFDGIRLLLLALALAGFTALRLRLFEFSLIKSQTLFLRHDAGQVHGETVGVVQAPHVCTTQLGTALGTSGMGILLKQFFTTVQCTSKRALFFIKNRLQISHPLGDLGKEVTHLLYQGWNEAREKVADRHLEVLANKARTPSQNAAQNVATAIFVRNAAVAYSKCQRTNMVGYDTVGRVNAIHILCAQRSSPCARQWHRRNSRLILPSKSAQSPMLIDVKFCRVVLYSLSVRSSEG